MLLDPVDNLILKYSWGIGNDTNNNVEALALWQGLYQAKALGIRDLTVFEDSRIIIQALTHHSSPSNLRLQQTLRRIQTLISSFRHLELFHIL